MALFGIDGFSVTPFESLPGEIYEVSQTISAAAGFTTDALETFESAETFSAAASFVTDGQDSYDKDISFDAVAAFDTDALETFDSDVMLDATAAIDFDVELHPGPKAGGSLALVNYIHQASRRRRRWR